MKAEVMMYKDKPRSERNGCSIEYREDRGPFIIEIGWEAESCSWSDLGDFFGEVSHRLPEYGVAPDEGSEILPPTHGFDRALWTHPSDATEEQIDALRCWLHDIRDGYIDPHCTVGVFVVSSDTGEEIAAEYLGGIEIDRRKDYAEQIREVATGGMVDEALAKAKAQIRDCMRAAAKHVNVLAQICEVLGG